MHRKFVKYGHVDFEIRERTDRQTGIHTDTLIAILRIPTPKNKYSTDKILHGKCCLYNTGLMSRLLKCPPLLTNWPRARSHCTIIINMSHVMDVSSLSLGSTVVRIDSSNSMPLQRSQQHYSGHYSQFQRQLTTTKGAVSIEASLAPPTNTVQDD